MIRFSQQAKILNLFPILIIMGGMGCQPTNVDRSSSDSDFEIPSPNLPGAPLIPERSVLRPFCRTSLGQISAGEAVATAFAVSIESIEAPVALTVFSLLEIGDNFSRRPNANELNAIKESITLSDAFGSMDGVVQAFSFVPILEAGFEDDPMAAAGNVLAINLPLKSKFKTFRLCEEMPKVGDKVWLSAALFNGAPPSQRQHSAVVTHISDQSIRYRFDNKKISFQGTQGAPLLNVDGKVIAIHLGMKDDSEPLVAEGNPTCRFLPYLLKALKN